MFQRFLYCDYWWVKFIVKVSMKRQRTGDGRELRKHWPWQNSKAPPVQLRFCFGHVVLCSFWSIKSWTIPTASNSLTMRNHSTTKLQVFVEKPPKIEEKTRVSQDMTIIWRPGHLNKPETRGKNHQLKDVD